VETTRAAIAELIGTFVVVLVAAGATLATEYGLDATGVALAQGVAFAAMVAATIHLGGGMLNPAVSIGLWVAGRRSTPRTVAVTLAQLLAGVAAGFVLRYVVPGTAFDAADGGTPVLASAIPPGTGIVVEALCTFILVFALFGTVLEDRGPSARASGLVAGLALTADALVFGPFTGAAANPARWFGPALASGTWADWYVWIVGPVAGGVMAAVLSSTVFAHDRRPAAP
jgi:glycerol uptake facilitator-like aquaporin